MSEENPRKRPRVPLTQTRIESYKPRARPYRKADGGGLFIEVTPAGGKLWRLAYRFEGKQRTLYLGAYDSEANGLTHARAKREAAKLALKAGRDPGRTAPSLDGQETFETVAREWHATASAGWADKYATLVLARLEQDVFPTLGPMPIASVNRRDVRAVLDAVAKRGAVETMHRLKTYISAVFRHSNDDTVSDPTPTLKGQLAKRPKVKHHKSIKAAQLGPFLIALENTPCEPETRLAILLTMLTAARTMEVIGARWDEFENLKYPKSALWRLPAERMKKDREHLVPISRQALSVLTALRERTGRSEFVFPSAESRTGHMSNNTMLFHAYAMG